MNWQTPAAALAGIVGVASIALCYVLVLTPPTVRHVQTSPPVLIATALSQTSDIESNPAPEPRLALTYDKAPDSSESWASQPDDVVRPGNETILGLAHAPAGNGIKQEPLLHLTAPKAVHLADHRHEVLVTNTEIAQIRLDLKLLKDQIPQWLDLVAALRQAVKLQPDDVDAGKHARDDLREGISADLKPYALPFLRSLSNDQMRNATRLSWILGFKSLSAMVDAVKASTVTAVVHGQTESRVAVTPALPPISKLPALADQRYDGLLTKAEIRRIKLSLKLTPDQEALWPPVAAILGQLGQRQMAQIDTGQKLDDAMDGAMAQRFYYAALPLLQTLNTDQKAEVRKRARVMGLESYASYL